MLERDERLTEHHAAPEIVANRDHDDDWKRIGLVDNYVEENELTLAQLYRPVKIVQLDQLQLVA